MTNFKILYYTIKINYPKHYQKYHYQNIPFAITQKFFDSMRKRMQLLISKNSPQNIK